jgi:hypothetical protein
MLGRQEGNRGKLPDTQLRHGEWCAAKMESFESPSQAVERRLPSLDHFCPGTCPGYVRRRSISP